MVTNQFNDFGIDLNAHMKMEWLLVMYGYQIPERTKIRGWTTTYQKRDLHKRRKFPHQNSLRVDEWPVTSIHPRLRSIRWRPWPVDWGWKLNSKLHWSPFWWVIPSWYELGEKRAMFAWWKEWWRFGVGPKGAGPIKGAVGRLYWATFEGFCLIWLTILVILSIWLATHEHSCKVR